MIHNQFMYHTRTNGIIILINWELLVFVLPNKDFFFKPPCTLWLKPCQIYVNAFIEGHAV